MNEKVLFFIHLECTEAKKLAKLRTFFTKRKSRLHILYTLYYDMTQLNLMHSLSFYVSIKRFTFSYIYASLGVSGLKD